MYAFVLERHVDYESDEVLGVFATKDAAIVAAGAYQRPWDSLTVTKWMVSDEEAQQNPEEVWRKG